MKRAVLFLIAMLGLVWSGAQAFATDLPKLLFYGWDQPSLEELQANGHRLTQSPFDGTAIRLSGRPNIFMTTPLAAADFDADRQRAAALSIPKLRDSYLVMNAAAADDFDWTNDTHWKASLENIRKFASVAKAAGLRGIVFDMEPYGKSPWTYGTQPAARNISFAAMTAVVRLRGNDMIRVIEREYPGAQIWSLYGLTALGDLVKSEKTPERIFTALAEEDYGLWPAFFAGWLEAASTDLRIVDGNEPAYYYTRRSEFVAARGFVRERLPALLPFELRPIYDRIVQAGSSVYVDGVLDLHKSPRFIGYYFTSDEARHALLRNNVINALTTASGVVWVYHENAKWFSQAPDQRLERSIRTALSRARSGGTGDENVDAIDIARKALDQKVVIGGTIVDADGKGLKAAGFLPQILERACYTYGDQGKFDCVLPNGWSGEIRPVVEGYQLDPPGLQLKAVTESQWSYRFRATRR
jgi:hypothetical protein